MKCFRRFPSESPWLFWDRPSLNFLIHFQIMANDRCHRVARTKPLSLRLDFLQNNGCSTSILVELNRGRPSDLKHRVGIESQRFKSQILSIVMLAPYKATKSRRAIRVVSSPFFLLNTNRLKPKWYKECNCRYFTVSLYRQPTASPMVFLVWP